MITSYLTDTVIQKRYKGRGDYGAPEARDTVTLHARVEYKNRLVNNAAGQTVVSMAKILLAPMTIIRSGFETRASGTLAFEDIFTVDGVDHPVIQIGRLQDFSVRGLEVWLA